MSLVLLAEHRRRAAHGKHRCGLCQERIAARELYIDQRLADSGTAWTWREHITCRELLYKLAREQQIDLADVDSIDAWFFADLKAESAP